MIITTKSKLCITLIIILHFLPCLDSSPQILGSCDFEGSDWLCGYQQATARDNSDWSRLGTSDGNHFMMVNTSTHQPGTSARLITPEIKLQDTHCFTFRAYIEDDNFQTPVNESTSFTEALGPSCQLNVYLLDKETSEVLLQPIWRSDDLLAHAWTTIQLALNPRAYQVVFEATVDRATRYGMIAIDDVTVSRVACESTPHFLRLGDKEVNTGRNETLQCLLWGHSNQDTLVTMQKSSGEILLPRTKEEFGDHMSALFGFSDVSSSDGGLYRCLSGNASHIGVSNYAHFIVKVPPTPKKGPKVVTPGATHFVIQLNSEVFTGDGPVVQTTLRYRPVDGLWSDVHRISSQTYDLWNLQPDTQYELTVTLARPGRGGTGPPGPRLRKRTKCGLPKSTVQNLNFVAHGPDDTGSITVQWDAPDLSITQCHNYAFVVKYRLYLENETDSAPIAYESERVEEKNSNKVTVHGLKTYTKYLFKVEITNSAGSKETEDHVVQTPEGVPDSIPPDSFAAVELNETAIRLAWDEPVQKNGLLQGYEISYRAESSYDPGFVSGNDKGLLQVSDFERRLVLTALHPGTNYEISIRAKTGAGFGKETEITARTDIAAPTIPRYSSVGSNDTVTTPTSIEITILPAQSNGAPITNYYVIVEEVTNKPTSELKSSAKPKNKKKDRSKKGKKKNRNQRSVTFLMSILSRDKRQATVDVSGDASACYDPPISFEDAQNSNQTAYAPARFSPDEISQETKFVVGAASSTNGLSNPALDPNKDYNIYVRVESSLNGETKVNCVLVAKKSRAVVTIPPPTTTIKTIKPVNTVDGDGINDPGDGKEDENTSAHPPGVKNKSEQDRIKLYAGIGGAVLVALLIAIAILFIVVRSKRRKTGGRKDKVVNPFEVRMMMSDINNPSHTLLPASHSRHGSADRQALMPDVVGYDHQDFMDKTSESGGAGYATSNDERFAVRVDDFHVHVSQMKATGGFGFREEFSSFVDGKNAPWTVADSPQNRSKNRYGNILAYDHSRVTLEPFPGYEEAFESDYINASYINGYKTPSMYIATQAPTVDTSKDFWWMIWQEKTTVIVMVTNLVEMGKRKCHKYWPNDKETYGTLDVALSSEEHMADYVVRSFVLQQAEGFDVREVKQFHFTAWPDHGVPSRPTNLLTYIRRIKNYEPQGQGPTVVHCSAGAGRTGCFIVIDMMLDMARDEEIVDINNTVRDLRSRRVNMVQTEEQYVFIHEAVLEALLCGETSVAASVLAEHYDELITVDSQTHFAPIEEEFETLHVITPKLSEDECSVARLPRNRASNRFKDVLPADRHLPYLVTPDPADRENNYINAVYLDSYSTKNSFLVTQMPLPNTVKDIWRLIYDHNCTSIVMMNDFSEHDETCSQYWPDSGTSMFGPFTVELLTKDDEIDVVTRLFKLQNASKPGEYRIIQQFQLANWPAAQPVPFSRNAVLRVIQLVTKWQTECVKNGSEGHTLVHCVAGAGRSGTFVACHNMCEQLRHEYSVDVFNTVQRLRNVRPQLVETLEQYRFCYEVGIEFAER